MSKRRNVKNDTAGVKKSAQCVRHNYRESLDISMSTTTTTADAASNTSTITRTNVCSFLGRLFNMTKGGIKCGLDPGDESQCRASALTYSITEIAILTPLNDTLITFSYGSVFSETSCYSNGNDSPHRRTVTPLLRALGCVRWARKVGVHFPSDVWYMFPIILPLPWGIRAPV